MTGALLYEAVRSFFAARHMRKWSGEPFLSVKTLLSVNILKHQGKVK